MADVRLSREQRLALRGLREVAVAIGQDRRDPRVAELMQKAKPLLQLVPAGPEGDDVRQKFERLEIETLHDLLEGPGPRAAR